MLSVNYETLHDFTALPTLRGLVARGEQGFFVTNLPFTEEVNVEKLHGLRLRKDEITDSTLSSQSTAVALMKALHDCSHEILNNISHVFELPWEKYLSEMHELTAAGADELRTVPQGTAVPNEWSSLTFIFASDRPKTILVLFGAALSVFSEGTTAELAGPEIGHEILTKFRHQPEGEWIVYYLRPNKDVFYTRTAGALMTPLSQEEYESRKRVKDISTN